MSLSYSGQSSYTEPTGIVGYYSQTGLTAAVTNAINATPPAGVVSAYRLTVLYRPTTTGASTSVGFTLGFKDSTGTVTETSTLAFLQTDLATGVLTALPLLNTGAHFYLCTFVFHVDSSATAITLSSTGTFTGTTYNLLATLERLA